MQKLSEETRILQCSTIRATLTCFISPFARYFRSRGHLVDGAAQGFGDSPSVDDAFTCTFDIPWSRNPLSFSNIAAVRRLRRVIEERQHQIVHVHTPVAAFLTRIALRREQRLGRVKVIYTAHGFHFHREGSILRNLAYGLLEKFVGRWTDYLVVINREDEHAAKRLRLVAPDRVRYMPGIGIDTSFYSPNVVDHSKSARTRAALGVDDQSPILLMVADFSPGKHHSDALRAFAAADSQASHLLLAGDGDEVESMRELANSLGIARRTHFLGLRDDVRELIHDSIVTILPSEREGLPRSIMESLCMQVPVIGTDIRGIRDLLSNAIDVSKATPKAGTFQIADSGLLVQVGDVEALTAAMNWILKHPEERRNMGVAGRAKMASYDIRRILELHEELYSEALELGPATNEALRHRAVPPGSGPKHSIRRGGWYAAWGKRTIDVLVSACLLAISLPLTAAIAVAIRITMGTPVIFRQSRPGFHGKIFRMYKFRTMSNAVTASGQPLSDALRVTRLGKFLRATSLDELPELWNVLTGTMSLIGPRPLLSEYLRLYTRQQQQRHDVLPGVSGLAQVRGRNATSWRRRFRFDTYYVNHVSPTLDLYILFATLNAIFHGDGGIAPIEQLDRLAEEAARRGSF